VKYVLSTILAVSSISTVFAQPAMGTFDAGAQVTAARSSEFDRPDVGFGGRFGWRAAGPISVEAEINSYPSDFPDGVPFSAARVEGFFGATIGPRLDRVRPFAKLRPGFMTFRAAPEPIACILIFPPPLSCTLASGRTLFAFDLGGGVEVAATRRTFLRFDAGDRVVKYPGPVFDSDRTAHENGFASHDFRFALGAGVRF